MRTPLPLFVLLAAASLPAQVALPAIFGDHMVLQRDKPNTIWGKASPGEAITVTLTRAGAEDLPARTTAGADGRWSARLDAQPAGESPWTLTIQGKNTITLNDLRFGEVWICSGQSNMEWSVANCKDGEAEIAAAGHPDLRLFTVKRDIAGEPRDDVSGSWSICSPQTVAGFSAVAYYFGRELHGALHVPIGLIHSSWGGTPAESWTSREALAAVEDCRPILERWDDIVSNAPARQRDFADKLAAWEKQAAEAKAAGSDAPRRPPEPPNPESPHRASGLYNAMIAPLTRLSIRGAIWYQGESNAGRAYQYRSLFPAMIRDWRQRFGQDDLPFLFVQLANFKVGNPLTWAELREAQTLALSLPNTAMAVTIDIGEAGDIHPKNKQDVGRRLALGAFAKVYGKDVAFSGPLYTGMSIDGNRVAVSFEHVAGGLQTTDGGPLRGFQIAGRDRAFVDAQATIDGGTVVVRAEGVAEPLAVRYAWTDNPDCNLINTAKLPASPFRSDDWPGVTDKAR